MVEVKELDFTHLPIKTASAVSCNVDMRIRPYSFLVALVFTVALALFSEGRDVPTHDVERNVTIEQPCSVGSSIEMSSHVLLSDKIG